MDEKNLIGQFYNGFRIQVRVIAALFLRETRSTFGSSSFGYLWAILTPTLGVALLVIIFSFASRQPPFGQSLALFFATGFLSYEFYNKLTQSIMSSTDANRALLLYPIVTPLAAVAARFFLITITYFIIMCLFYWGLILLKLAEYPSYPIQLCYAFIAIGLLGLSIGLVNISLMNVWSEWRFIWQIINRPIFFISGIFFIPSLLPEYVLRYLKWNPVLHLIEWVRSAYYPNYDSRVLDIGYLFSVTFLFIAVGLFAERLLRFNK